MLAGDGGIPASPSVPLHPSLTVPSVVCGCTVAQRPLGCWAVLMNTKGK